MRRMIVLSLVALLGLTASAEAGFLARVKERREARRAGACQPAAPQAAFAPAAAPPQTIAPAVSGPAAFYYSAPAGSCASGSCGIPQQAYPAGGLFFR